MTRHPFDCDFKVTAEQKIQFRRDGCVKLDGFLNDQVLRMLRDRVEVEIIAVQISRCWTGSALNPLDIRAP